MPVSVYDLGQQRERDLVFYGLVTSKTRNTINTSMIIVLGFGLRWNELSRAGPQN